MWDTNIKARWLIYYIGYNYDVPTLVLSAAGLVGGKNGTSPTVVAGVRR
jgi:hypothetical protein